MKRTFTIVSCLAATPSIIGAPSELAERYGSPTWPPELVGGLIGALVCLSMILANKPIGASSAYASVAGLLGRSLARRRTLALPYYRDNPPGFDYSVVFLLAIVAGSFVAAWHGNQLDTQMLPAFWQDMFGTDSTALRFSWTFLGGGLLSFGARTAGGCTSGHGISGALQLSAASWIALLCFFIGGVVAAKLLYPY